MTRSFSLPGAMTVRLTSSVAATFIACRQGWGQDEAGGILLGRVFEASGKLSVVQIEGVSTPSEEDARGPRHFDRCPVKAQRLIREAWSNSRGECIYLGEWHTHPEPHPTPSSPDRVMIRQMLRGTQMEISVLLLTIVGTVDCWMGLEDGRVLRHLPPA